MKTKTLFLFVLLMGIMLHPMLTEAQITAPKKQAEKAEISNGQRVILERESKLSFTETVERIQNEALAIGWKVTIVHDLQATMKKNGADVLPVKVIELCQPKLALKILQDDAARSASAMMPCRVSVYEKADGKTYISVMNSEDLSQSLSGTMATVMTAATKEIETLIKPLLR